MLSKRKINKVNLLNNKKNLRLDKFIEMALFGNNGYYLRKKPIGRNLTLLHLQKFHKCLEKLLVYI